MEFSQQVNAPTAILVLGPVDCGRIDHVASTWRLSPGSLHNSVTQDGQSDMIVELHAVRALIVKSGWRQEIDTDFGIDIGNTDRGQNEARLGGEASQA
eukprot:2918191-Amphidinium_carterae.1